MAWDPYRPDRVEARSTRRSWIRRNPNKETTKNLQADGDWGIDTNPPRWPQRPKDIDGLMVYMTGNEQAARLTAANYRLYAGLTLNPQFDNGWERVVEKEAHVLLPVGSEGVQYTDFAMPDDNPQFGDFGTDIIPQKETYQWIYQAHTAITAAVDLVAGYAIGTTVIHIDTLSVAFGLRPGSTISITTGGVARYYVIKSIVYDAAGTDADVTLCFGLTFAIVNNDVITTAHAADAPIFFPCDTIFWGKLFAILHCVQSDVSVPDADLLPVVAYAAGGIAVDTVAIVPGTFGGLTEKGGVGLQLGTALETGDRITLTARFYDYLIRPHTVGEVLESGTARTAAGEENTSHVLTVLKS